MGLYQATLKGNAVQPPVTLEDTEGIEPHPPFLGCRRRDLIARGGTRLPLIRNDG